MLLTVLLLMGAACKKSSQTIAKGQLIQADGSVVDPVKNKKLPNVKLYLFGAYNTYSGVDYIIGPLDSTLTDAAGNFSIRYLAEGLSLDYALTLFNDATSSYPSQSYVADAGHLEYPFYLSHQVSGLTISARELNYARIHLQVSSNPYDTLHLRITSESGYFYLGYSFVGESIDTVLLARFLPDEANAFQYIAQPASLLDSGFVRQVTDVVNPGLSDTITLDQTILSVYDLPLTQN
ncbi:MAG: hypothetical protein P4L51_17450 [Puia sp.]|nr:hypothetical protein [Puia sp.]